MKINYFDLLDFKKINSLLEGFNKTTGFVTAILDLEGNVLSQSGWRQICTDFHRVHSETAKRCTKSDTMLANKMEKGKEYHMYKCLNGLIDVAVPLKIKGEHVANLFTGQFFTKEPDVDFFKKQAKEYGFNEKKYLNALGKVPVLSEEKVKTAMDFLVNMTEFITELAMQKLEQDKINQKVKISEQKFREVFENSPLGKSITKLDGTIESNKAFAQMLGYTFEEFKNIKWQEITHPDDIEVSTKVTESLLKDKEKSVQFEKRYIHKNGSVVTAEVQVTLLRDKQSKPLVFITTIKDITKQKEIEIELRESNERFRIAQEMSPDGFTILHPIRNKQGQVVDFSWIYENQAVAKINGTDPKEVVGKRLLDLFPGHKGTQFFKAYKQVVENGESVSFEDGYVGETIEKHTNFRIVVVPMAENIAILAQDITERKRSEIELKESEALFRATFEQAAVGVAIIHSGTGKFIEVNKKYSDIVGYTMDEMNKLTFQEITHPDDLKEDLENMNLLLSEEIDNFTIDKRYVKKDKSIVWVNLSASKLWEDVKNDWYILGIIKDITARKLAEEKNKQDEKRLQSFKRIAEYVPESMQHLLDYALKEAINLTDSKIGYIYFYSEEKKEFELSTWSKGVMKECSVINPQTKYELDKTGIWGEVVRQRKEIVVNDFQKPNSLKKGKPKGHAKLDRFMSIPVLENNKIVAVVGLANKESVYNKSDVDQIYLLMTSVWKLVQKQNIEEKNRQLYAAVEQSPVSIVITDKDARIEYVNEKFTEISGYALNEILNNNPNILSSGKQDKKFYKEMWETLLSGKDWEGEMQNKKKNGELFWEYALISPVKNLNGVITHFIGVKEDITDKKEINRQLKERNEEYLALNEELNQTNKELFIAKEKAEESNRLKTAFLENMSHEIRTPMNGILGFSKMLKNRNLPEAKKEKFIEIINTSGNQLLHIVNDILDISRIETGQIELYLDEFDLIDFIKKTLQFFHIQAKEKGVEINLLIDAKINKLIISADQARLKQIIDNLISNALKFTDSGKIDVGFAIEKSKLKFFVKDTGTGIAKKHQKQIFDRFAKVNDEKTKLYGGTGLGLAICKGIVDKMNGEIWVESEAHKGASFYFTIPFVRSENKEEEIIIDRIENDFQESVLLIVEDDLTSYNYLEEILSNARFRCIHAKSGKEAIELFNQNIRIDIILMDIQMPEMDGYTATKLIREKNNEIPIIAQTAYAFPADREKAIQAGCNDYISKPIDEDLLINLLDKYLS